MLLGLLGCGASPNNRALSLTILWTSVVWLVDFSGAPCDSKLPLNPTGVSRRTPVPTGGAAFQTKEHGLLKRLPPARSGGFPPPDFVTNRREDSSLVINTSRSGKTRSIQQNGAWRPQPGGRHASNVSQSSLRTAPNTKHIVYRSLSRETLLARSVE